jgi:hypothetical protein
MATLRAWLVFRSEDGRREMLGRKGLAKMTISGITKNKVKGV